MKSNKDVVYIYAIRNKNNGKVYIGRTENIERRVIQHWYEKRGSIRRYEKGLQKKKLTQFEIDLKEMGEGAFEIYQIEANVPKKRARARESFWIAKYDSTNPDYGYNKRMERRRRVKITEGKPPNMSKD